MRHSHSATTPGWLLLILSLIVALLAGVWVLQSAMSGRREAAEQSTQAGGTDSKVATSGANATTGNSTTNQPTDPPIYFVWREVPPWATDLPFDMQSYFYLPPEENREELYFEAFSHFGQYFLRQALAKQGVPEAEWQTRLETLDSNRRKLIDFFLEQILDQPKGYVLSEAESVTAKNLLEPYAEGLQLLLRTGDRPKCFFHKNFEILGISNVDFLPGSLETILELKCRSALADPQVLDLVAAMLRLERDLGGLIRPVQHTGAWHRLSSIYTDVVAAWLGRPELTEAEAQRMVAILNEHHQQSSRQSLLLEVAKSELLIWRNLFDSITNKTFFTKANFENASLGADAGEAALLIRAISHLDFHRVNAPVVLKEVHALAKSDWEIRRALAEIERGGSKVDPDELADKLLPLFLISSISRGKFEVDIEVLNERFRQTSAALALGFPEAWQPLQELEQRWTRDSSWQQSQLLRFFLPGRGRLASQLRQDILTNAYLSLAAIRYWRLVHPNELPESMEQVMAFAGVSIIPIDPYSGGPFKMLVTPEEIVVYSIGPDRIDDQGQVVRDFDRSIYGNQPGDFLFRVKVK